MGWKQQSSGGCFGGRSSSAMCNVHRTEFRWGGANYINGDGNYKDDSRGGDGLQSRLDALQCLGSGTGRLHLLSPPSLPLPIAIISQHPPNWKYLSASKTQVLSLKEMIDDTMMYELFFDS